MSIRFQFLYKNKYATEWNSSGDVDWTSTLLSPNGFKWFPYEDSKVSVASQATNSENEKALLKHF